MTNTDQSFDVAIIGAGLAGLICANHLQQQGYRVIILEKSKGLGGRLATRRVDQSCLDHGLSYFVKQGNNSQLLIEDLTQKQILKSLVPKLYNLQTILEPITVSGKNYYYSPQGMTAIAKELAQNLTVWRDFRVISLTPTQEKYWRINGEAKSNSPNFLMAKRIVSAIPAPQLLLLLQASYLSELPPYFVETLKQVSYAPCFCVMAGYNNLNTQSIFWDQVQILEDSDVAWIGLENRKREIFNPFLLVLHSTTNYAQAFLESTDLNFHGQYLLNQVANLLSSPLKSPDWYQIHRWRYAIPLQSLPISCLNTDTPLPLVACGDWCAGSLKVQSSLHLEKALTSGIAAANEIIKN